MSARPSYVYELYEEGRVPKYVGVTRSPQTRLSMHCSAARRTWATGKTMSAKNRWLMALLSRDIAPKLRVIEIVAGGADPSRREWFWIRARAGEGARLVNVQWGPARRQRRRDAGVKRGARHRRAE